MVVAEERAAPQSWALLKNGLWGRVLDGSHVTLTNVSESVANVGRLPNIPVGPRFPCTSACVRATVTRYLCWVCDRRTRECASRPRTAVDGRKEMVCAAISLA